ncbi:MAG: S41 family peptidase [Cyclobacteriaceae bacterium]
MKININLFPSHKISLLGLLLLCFVIVSSCEQEDDAGKAPRHVSEINNFIWENMDIYYFWRDKMPRNIDRSRELDSKAYFSKLLYKDDIWSIITDDYQELNDRLSGIEKSAGFSFKLLRVTTGSSDIIGVVELVYPNSSAANTGIKRGDIFVKVDDQNLTINNYQTLLFGRDQYKITLGEVIDGQAVENGTSYNLTTQTLNINPIFYADVIETPQANIGYLVYNQFISEYNDQLRNTFAEFKANGVNELVLDLRYNPGGAVLSATLLASLIAPKSTIAGNNIFMRYIWNSVIEEYMLGRPEGEENLIIRFKDEEANLNLSRVHILTTRNTASSSELIINCLKPYMDVVVIGEATSGKYTGSITLNDEDEKHNWAIQPIVLKSANVNGETDYRFGLAPDVLALDDLFYPLGSLDETLLGLAYLNITGSEPARFGRVAAYHQDQIITSVHNIPYAQRSSMDLDVDILPLLDE